MFRACLTFVFCVAVESLAFAQGRWRNDLSLGVGRNVVNLTLIAAFGDGSRD